MIYKSILILILQIALFNHCQSQVGDLDTDFGTNGVSIIDFEAKLDVGRSVAVQSDGKILFSGKSKFDFALTRFGIRSDMEINEILKYFNI